MSRKSGGSITITWRSATDAQLTEPVVVMELDAHPGWEVVATVDVTRSTLRGFSVQPAGKWLAGCTGDAPKVAEPHGGVTARMVRSLPLGEITAIATGAIRSWAQESITQRGWLGPSAWPHLDAQVDTWQQSLSTRPGRRGRPDADYLDLVLAYLRCLDAGDPHPVASLAKSLHAAPSTIRNTLYEARSRRKLLTASPPGRPGGELTPKALALLEHRNKEMTDGQH